MSYGQISAQGTAIIYSFVHKWTATGSVDWQPGSGRHRLSSREENKPLTNIIENSPFSTAVQTTGITNFPDSVKTARRRIKESDLKNYAAARNTILRPYHKE